jgi:hypothetical protein
VGKDISRQARAETMAKAASSGAETVRTHAEQAAHSVRAAAATGVRTAREAVHGSRAFQDATEQVKQAAGPARDAARDAAQHIAEEARRTAGSLTARAGHPGHRRARSWPVRGLFAGLCALGAGTLIWWLARTPEDGTPAVLPVQPVPPA